VVPGSRGWYHYTEYVRGYPFVSYQREGFFCPHPCGQLPVLTTLPRLVYSCSHLSKDESGWVLSDFDAESSSYSREKFYVAASDKNGHNTSLRVRVPPQISGQIHALIASGQFPYYRTVEDLHRDALIHRLHDLSDMEDVSLTEDMQEMLVQQEAISQMEAKQRRIESDQTVYRMATDLARDGVKYPGIIDTAIAHAELIRNGDLRDDALRVIDRFRH
jgi:hypothetical protein